MYMVTSIFSTLSAILQRQIWHNSYQRVTDWERIRVRYFNILHKLIHPTFPTMSLKRYFHLSWPWAHPSGKRCLFILVGFCCLCAQCLGVSQVLGFRYQYFRLNSIFKWKKNSICKHVQLDHLDDHTKTWIVKVAQHHVTRNDGNKTNGALVSACHFLFLARHGVFDTGINIVNFTFAN